MSLQKTIHDILAAYFKESGNLTENASLREKHEQHSLSLWLMFWVVSVVVEALMTETKLEECLQHIPVATSELCVKGGAKC